MPSLWKDLLTAIKGEEKEFTKGSIKRAIFMLSIPMILEMVMESLFAVVDVFFVAKGAGTAAVATIGLTESVITLVYSVAIGLSMAATAIVARRIGENKPEEAAVSAVQALIIGSSLSILLGILGVIFADDILRFMDASESLIEENVSYTRIMFGGNIVIMLLFMLNGVFRGAGDASIAMRSLWLANIINIILDPCLIFGLGPFPEMGITGAAIATTIGRGIAVIYQLNVLFRGNGIIKVFYKHLIVKVDIILRMINVGITGILQFLIASASWIFLMKIISGYGENAIAGYTIAIRIMIFTILPSWGMSNAAATLVGQNLGAKQPERAEISVWKTAFYNMVFLFIVGLLFFLFAEPIIRIFSSEPAVVSEGTSSLRIVCLGYVFFAYGMVIGQAFNGAGDTRTPTVLNFIAFWLIQIPLAYYMAGALGFGTDGVYWAIAISESILALMCIIMFKRGRWKTTEV